MIIKGGFTRYVLGRLEDVSLNLALLWRSFPGGWLYRVCLQGSRPGFCPWVGKIPWRREWQPIQYSCLENFWDRGNNPWDRIESGTIEWLTLCSDNQDDSEPVLCREVLSNNLNNPLTCAGWSPERHRLWTKKTWKWLLILPLPAHVGMIYRTRTSEEGPAPSVSSPPRVINSF